MYRGTETQLCSSSRVKLSKISVEESRVKLSIPSKDMLFCYQIENTAAELPIPPKTGMETLILNCPSLQYLRCSENQLRKMELNCPSLQELDCHENELTELELNCPFLRGLRCNSNYFTEIVGIEFCCDLEYLEAPCSAEAFLENSKTLLPNTEFSYW